MDEFYCAPDDNGDFPDAQFGLGNIPTEILEEASELLFFLEAIDWKWDIVTVKKQPAALFKAVLKLKVTGEKLKRQDKKKKGDDGR